MSTLLRREMYKITEKTTDDLRKRETSWKSEKASLDREINSLKKQLKSMQNGEGAENEDRGWLGVEWERWRCSESSHESDKPEDPGLTRSDSEKFHVIDLKKSIAILEKKVNYFIFEKRE